MTPRGACAADSSSNRIGTLRGVCGTDDLLRIADKALYRAKYEGRDRVVAAGLQESGRAVPAGVSSPAG